MTKVHTVDLYVHQIMINIMCTHTCIIIIRYFNTCHPPSWLRKEFVLPNSRLPVFKASFTMHHACHISSDISHGGSSAKTSPWTQRGVLSRKFEKRPEKEGFAWCSRRKNWRTSADSWGSHGRSFMGWLWQSMFATSQNCLCMHRWNSLCVWVEPQFSTCLFSDSKGTNIMQLCMQSHHGLRPPE